MKTLIHRKHLVIYTDEADKLNKIAKINRGDLKGFIFVGDSIIHHFIDEKNDLERQLEEARSNRYIEITAIRTRFESFMSGNWSAQEFRDYMKQLKDKGDEV